MLKIFAKRILNSALFKMSGMSLINYDLLQYTKHYLWILHLSKVPTLKLVFKDAKPVTKEDIVFCERLIRAYHAAVSNKTQVENTVSRLWKDSLKKYSYKLTCLMESKDAAALAKALSRMFREDFVYGLASGSLVKNCCSPIGRKIWSLKYQDNLVCLAEALGLVRAESPQQGAKVEALKEGADAIAAKIESALGISICFPDIGAPYGVMANQALISMEHPEHLYVAIRAQQAVRDYLKSRSCPLRIAEIGAGFGGLCYWMFKLRRKEIAAYTIIDLPLINVLQGYFLAGAFGASAVCLYGENNPDAYISIVPCVSFKTEVTGPIDLLINENSMPEMSDPIVENYIRWAARIVTGIFFSYNHEAYSLVFGKPQVLVSQIINKCGGFKLLSRNPSWVRSGYVEEVYAVKEGS